MSRLHSHRDRPVHMGVLPTERLRRDPEAPPQPAVQPGEGCSPGVHAVSGSVPEYRRLLSPVLDGAVASARAPIPDDLVARQQHLKAAVYFLDATLAGVCRLNLAERGSAGGYAPTATTASATAAQAATHTPVDTPAHTHALVFLIEFGREPAEGEPGDAWVRGSNVERTDLRCAEVAAVLAGYLRTLGWQARGHVACGM